MSKMGITFILMTMATSMLASDLPKKLKTGEQF